MQKAGTLNRPREEAPIKALDKINMVFDAVADAIGVTRRAVKIAFYVLGAASIASMVPHEKPTDQELLLNDNLTPIRETNGIPKLSDPKANIQFECLVTAARIRAKVGADKAQDVETLEKNQFIDENCDPKVLTEIHSYEDIKIAKNALLKSLGLPEDMVGIRFIPALNGNIIAVDTNQTVLHTLTEDQRKQLANIKELESIEQAQKDRIELAQMEREQAKRDREAEKRKTIARNMFAAIFDKLMGR